MPDSPLARANAATTDSFGPHSDQRQCNITPYQLAEICELKSTSPDNSAVDCLFAVLIREIRSDRRERIRFSSPFSSSKVMAK